MKRARKSSNRVSWATGINLCQVKLFLSDECPSKVGQKSQDHLQAKTSSILHSSTVEYNDLPPGFECNQFLINQSKNELFHIPRINWRCPPSFVFSYNWHVAAGEESREKEDQKLRELRVLEAVYPRLSAIPLSPSISLEVEEEDYDDNLTPLVPIIPIEEEESIDNKPELAAPAVDALATVPSQNLHQCTSATTTPIQCKISPSVASPACGNPLPGISPGSEVDLAAASTVVAAIMKSNQQGSLIDMDLLVRIFNDPKMIEKLVNDHRTAATTVSASSNTVGIHTSVSKPATPSVPLSTATTGEPAYGVTPTSAVGSLSASGMKPATPSVSLLTPVPEKSATPLISMFRPIPGKPATTSVPLSTPAPDMQSPVNRNVHHMSNRVLPTLDTQPPQQDTILASGAKQAASLASIPMTSSGGILHPVTNQVRSTTSTMLYQASTGSAHPVKDANYLKNLIRQHGSNKQGTQDLQQIGIRHSNFQDLKSVHNNNKPGEVQFKIQKTCIFFKSSKGCRNGSNCPYQHDMSVQWGDGNVLGSQNAKRLKLGPEIKGRI